MSGLADRSLHRFPLSGQKLGAEELLLTELHERLRTVVVSPDDAVYVLTDSIDGRLLRVSPGESHRRITRRNCGPAR